MSHAAGPGNSAGDIFRRDNLAAWCIVPFDAKKRGPEERAAMLEKMGLRKFAYDYRAEHIPQWDEELEALKRHHIELFAWWFPGSLNDEAKKTLELFKRHGVKPQLWVSGNGGSLQAASPEEQKARVAAEARRLKPIAVAAAELGCQVALYNHGAWFGEPDNQLAIIAALKSEGVGNVGMVYNLHHGHDHLPRLKKILPKILPHLLCLNLNGTDEHGDARGRKILPLGAGTEDVRVLSLIRDSGYKGVLGILNHTNEDAEGRLLDNLEGLDWLLPQIKGEPAGEKPKYRTWTERKVGFSPDRKPLREADVAYWQHPVNRDRIFDFYAKEALHFMKQNPLPDILPDYPGLDGGKLGHWGNQNDEVWKDGRWAASDLGVVFSTAFKGAGLTVPKGVCVWLGDKGEVAACFDPETLSYPLIWEGGFVKLSDVRHGFMGGGQMDGKLVKKTMSAKPAAAYKYHGYYRHGKQVVFAYDIAGTPMLDSAWVEGGAFKQERAPLTEHSLRQAIKGGPSQWPQWIETKGKLGTGEPFATDTLTLPFENPHGTLFFVSGHDFFSDGTAALATMTGEVWLVKGLDKKLEKIQWKRFATGLHQPLGVKIVKDKLYVLGRDQITCLHDLNGDSEADFYECITNAQITSPGGHDYITGLEIDEEGRFYFASGNQGVCRVKPGEAVEVLATGFRNPNGLGLTPSGMITTSVQEGDWTPASEICQVKMGGHYGAGGPKNGVAPELPLLYMPRGEDNSSGGQTTVSGKAWAPLAGQENLVHMSPGGGTAYLVMRQQVNDRWQGAAVRIAASFDSGSQTGRFHPLDGQLYVSGMTGWGSYTPADGCFQRMRFTGGKTPVPVSSEARDNGILLRFSEPLDKNIASQPGSHFAQCWNYRYSAAYGSAEYSVKNPQRAGHDPLQIRSAHVLEDGRALFLEVPQLTPANVIHLHVSVSPERFHDLYLTAHSLAPAFTDYPGYQPIVKTTIAPAAVTPTMVLPAPAKPNPWIKGEAGRRVTIEAALGLQFAQKQLVVKAGERISIVLGNPDVVPHNWVLAKPGSLQAMGQLANLMITDPDGLSRHYIPQAPEILAYTDMVNPGAEFTIHLTAPNERGDYPYLCTFPGHWMVMNGVLRVE